MKQETETIKLIHYIKGLEESSTFQITKKGLRNDRPADEHIGAIIVDATLSSPRHNYKRQVEKRVRNLRNGYPSGVTTSGFLDLIKNVGLDELLMGWEKKSERKEKQKQVMETAQLFSSVGVETFTDLSDWIRKKENQRKLKSTITGIGNKTADYYRVLVSDPDAVAVDKRISIFLENAGIDVSKYSYQLKKSIVQETAIMMGHTPLDLEQSIWHSNPKRIQKETKMNKVFKNDVKNDSFLVHLPAEKMRQLEVLARESAQDPSTLLSIWAIDRLKQLGTTEPSLISGTKITPRLPSALESLEDVKKRLADLIDDHDEKCLFLQTTRFKQWANYIAGLVLTKNGKTLFSPKDIRDVLHSELIPQHYGNIGAQKKSLLTADVCVEAPGNSSRGFPCLQRDSHGIFRFIGFKKGIETFYGEDVLAEKLSKCRKE